MKNFSLLSNIHKTTERALRHIEHEQETNGSFSTATGSCSTFYTSLIGSLLKNSDPVSVSIKNRIVSFLLREKSTSWSFNYWQKDSPERMTMPYPDDLDDTFVALQAIDTFDRHRITEDAWLAIVTLLTDNECAEGGPYYTWILPAEQRRAEWSDVDIVVNSNIAVFLSRYDIALPKLQDFFDAAIHGDQLSSQYYHDECLLIYFLSKAYTGVHKNILRQKLLQQRSKAGYWDSPLKTACCITALLQLGEHPKRLSLAIEYLLRTEDAGKWMASPLFIEYKKSDAITYSTCEAFVSACCFEALTMYTDAISIHQKRAPSSKELFIRDVVEHARKRFENTSLVMQKQFDDLLHGLAAKDPHGEIILLPYHFAEHLTAPVPTETVRALAVANLHGWIGYGIKDSVMDGASRIPLLPCSSICIREAIQIFESHATRPDTPALISAILDDIEISNGWEQSNCKLEIKDGKIILPRILPHYGNYTVLAKKSFGHAIGPLLLYDAVQPLPKRNDCYGFFMHYLIARQLNDDAHDWVEDLKNGFLNSVSVDIIRQWQKHSTKNYIILDLEQDLLEQLFWERHIESVTKKILHHCKKARTSMKEISVLKNTDFLEALIHPLEVSARKAVSERNKVRNFITQLR